jgi:CheY-like chemotaxis protein
MDNIKACISSGNVPENLKYPVFHMVTLYGNFIRIRYGKGQRRGKGKIQILHVDDEAVILDLTWEFLKREGKEEFEITSVLSAEEALAELAKERFDVIISDFRMPRMDGLEFLEEVRNMGEYVPFVLFSGMAEPEVVTEVLERGADRYISKAGNPVITFTELAHTIRELVKEKEKKGMEMRREGEEQFLQVIAR